METTVTAGDRPKTVVHFKKKKTVHVETAKALGELILAAQRAVRAAEDLVGRRSVRHGFKAQAERSATAARVALGLRPYAPLDPWSYANHLKVTILEFGNLGLRAQTVRQLTTVDGDSWSAMTLKMDETFAIVINPSHALTRQRSDLAHELSHIELCHVPARVEVSETGLLLLSDFSDEQEQEADGFAGALMLPREGLVRLRSDRKSTPEIAIHILWR